jgi:hydroxypyruvate reductase
MLSAESFWTSSLRTAPEGERLTRIFAAAITAVEPGAAVGRFVQRDGDMLTISGRAYDLQLFRRVVLLGIGKASVAMAEALVAILGDRLSAGLVIPKRGTLGSPGSSGVVPVPGRGTGPASHSPLTILIGGHPVPDERSLKAGQKTIELVSSLGPDDLLICVLSGGGSALVTAPVDGVSLADTQVLTSALLACGARIDEINTLRRRLDKIKGGGIAKMTNGTTIVSLILSDVVGSALEAIASGPTAPDPATRAEALSILAKYELENRIPISILHSLRTSPETPKPGDHIFEKVQNVLVGSNLLAAQAALGQADVEGFHPYLLRTDMQGEARATAFELATFLRHARLTGDPLPGPACIVAGGETTVTLTGNGKGGRNTELALAAVSELADFPGVMMATLATDGEDGLTDAAGAVVTGETFRRAAGLGLHPGLFLKRNDSYSFFAALDDLLKPGPTGTNVNDLVFLFIF